MSNDYVSVNWNRQKRIYDALIGLGVVGSITVFGAVTAAAHPSATIETILIRGLGITGLLLLQLILMIGPLARLDRRFLPLLYNRRHLGVTLGLLAVAHAGFVIVQYHALGDRDPFVSVLTANQDWTSLANFPFELFGLVALIILFLMAVTSHDYWLSALTPPVWKRLHMLVYVAYVALLFHVGLGFLQDERSPLYGLVLGLGAATVGGLHLIAARRERPIDDAPDAAAWMDVCAADEVPEGRAKIGLVGGERVAVFRHENRLSCVSNVCKHQNGPLGEGRIIDGCITCPWHGYQYRPDSGTSPPPFTDSIPTFNLKVAAGRVLVDRRPNPPGTRVEPVAVPPAGTPRTAEFYVGYQPTAPQATAKFAKTAAVTTLLLSLGLTAGLALAQQSFDASTFDYGHPTTIEGRLATLPYPMLETSTGAGAQRRIAHYLLAASGKHGATPLVAGETGRSVRIVGTLAFRDHLSLLEIASIAPTADSTASPERSAAPVDLGRFRLEGEIVDSKCYTGVMNPGRGKTHRGCAARCLSGGMTPLFVTRDSTGKSLEMIVVGPALSPRYDLSAIAGRRLALAGRVLRQDDLWFLQLDQPGSE